MSTNKKRYEPINRIISTTEDSGTLSASLVEADTTIARSRDIVALRGIKAGPGISVSVVDADGVNSTGGSSIIISGTGAATPNINVSATAPTVNDDVNSVPSYQQGSGWIYINGASRNYYVCLDNTAGAAVWERIDQPQSNYSATINPTINDDINTGYEIGSIWLNTVLDIAYICVNNTAGAASWLEIQTSDGAIDNWVATTNPTFGNNASSGYGPGSIWYNSDTTTGPSLFICTFSDNTTATWVNTSRTKDTMDAVLAPAVTNDVNQGYSVGSTWFNKNSGKLYVATGVSAGAASWKQVVGSGLNTAATDPIRNTHHKGAGYDVGAMWYNTTTTTSFICVQSSVSNSLWVPLPAAKSFTTIPTGVTDPDGNPNYGYNFDYRAGSMALTTDNDILWVCTDHSSGTNPRWSFVAGSGKWSTSATSDPVNGTHTTNNGYLPGAMWHNSTTNTYFIKIIANWVRVSDSKFRSDTVNPVGLNDASQGYSVGSMWVNTTDDSLHICIDNSNSAANWVKVSGGSAGGPTSMFTGSTTPGAAENVANGFPLNSFYLKTLPSSTDFVLYLHSADGVWHRASKIKSVYNQSVLPASGNDNTQGYEVGSIWHSFISGGSSVHICRSAATGAAIWDAISSAKISVSALDPTPATMSLTEGFSVGSMHFNTSSSSSNDAWICTAASAGASTWKNISRNKVVKGTATVDGKLDISAEYYAGDMYYNTDLSTFYVCVDNAYSAAEWISIPSGLKTNATSTDPTASNDSTNGYTRNSVWLNVVNNTWWVCIDDTPLSAKWARVSRDHSELSYDGSIPADANVKYYQNYLVNSATAAHTLIVPSATAMFEGASFSVTDVANNAATNNITIQFHDTRLYQTTFSGNDPTNEYIINSNGGAVTFEWTTANGWIITKRI